jgi:putative signal transducing protein
MKTCDYCGRQNDDTAELCVECGKALAQRAEPTDPQLLDPALRPVIVATFSNLQQASVLAARLQAAGIEATIPEEYAPQVFSAVIPLERITVRVPAKDYEAAKAFLASSPETQTGPTEADS